MVDNIERKLCTVDGLSLGDYAQEIQTLIDEMLKTEFGKIGPIKRYPIQKNNRYLL